MSDPQRVPVPNNYSRIEGSERRRAPHSRRLGPANPQDVFPVSIRVRRRADGPALPGPDQLRDLPVRTPFSRDDFAKSYGAAEADLQQVADFAKSCGLSLLGSDIARRVVEISGTVDQMSRAFAVSLGLYQIGSETYRSYEGYVHVPSQITALIKGIFGLDNRRVAFRGESLPLKAAALTPVQVANLYNFPTTSAAGQTIGLIEMGGGYQESDIAQFFNSLGPPFVAPTLIPVNVGDGSNDPLDPFADESSELEVVLDICVAGAVAQGAKIAVYFAEGDELGWQQAIGTAVHDQTNNPSVLSISWSNAYGDDPDALSKSSTTTSNLDGISEYFQDAYLLNVTVLVSSGDMGSYSDVDDRHAHVQYPATDPWVTSCGGTTISNVFGASFTENAWTESSSAVQQATGQQATGGGVSAYFPLPSWQAGVGVPPSVNDNHVGRGVPDIAGNASPSSGYTLWVNGEQVPGYGTSAVAPLYAGLIAICNASLGRNVGFLNPLLYQLNGSPVFRDIADGSTNALNGAPGYTCGPGWDACTGLGVIDGSALLAALKTHFGLT